MSRSALARKVTTLDSQKKRAANAAEALGDKMFAALGSGTAFATAAGLGWAEVKFAKNGKPLTLGPVKLSLAASAALNALSLFYNPQNQVSYAAAGAAAAYGATWGRGVAVAATAKRARKKSGVGYEEFVGLDEMTDEEAEMLGS